ncbi:MAG: glycosyltransferase family 39 protein [Deltaproteobacteria bacterium]|nr:glycosyltransferase family 39 protein [Deltaproteobacteria bacterium]
MNRSIDKYPIALFLLWFVFFFLPVGNRSLWNPDEPRYLQVAWEMVQAKAYLVPVFNGELYAHKPPLFFWLTILMSKISAFETASRYVSALMSLGTIFLTYLIGKRYGGKKIGFVAALILMTSGFFLWLTGTGNIDTTLTFLTTLSFYSFIQYGENKKWLWIFLAYLSCGVGILAKGPVALLIPWLTFLAWTIYKSHFKKEEVPYIHLVWGPFIAIGIAALWMIPACIAGGETYTRELLFTHNIGRTVKSFAHQSPWYYYILNFTGIFAPWSLVFLAAMFGIKKELKEDDEPLSFYLTWFFTTFLFFSMFSGKRGQYLLPAYPAFSLFLANIVNRWDRRGENSFSIRLIIFLILGIGVFVLLAPPFIPFFNKNLDLLADVSFSISGWRLWTVYSIGILSLIILWMSYANLKLKKYMEACMFFVFAVLLYLGILQISISPGIDHVKSLKYFSNEIKEVVPKSSTIAFYKKYSQRGLNFYLNRPVIPVVSHDQLQNVNPPYDFILRERRNKGRKPIRLGEVSSIKMMGYNGYKAIHVKKIGSKEYTLWKLMPEQ